MTAQQPTGRVMLKNVRLAFAQGIHEPTKQEGSDGDPKYNCKVIIPPDHSQLDEIRKKQRAVAAEKWGAKADATYSALEKQDRLALHDGDTKPNWDGFPGNFFISPSSPGNKAMPTIVMWWNGDPRMTQDGFPKTAEGRAEREAFLKEARSRLYSGCYVNISFDLWAQDNGFGKRINPQLRGVQFLRDGDAFSAGRPADADEFEEVSEGADAGDIA